MGPCSLGLYWFIQFIIDILLKTSENMPLLSCCMTTILIVEDLQYCWQVQMIKNPTQGLMLRSPTSVRNIYWRTFTCKRTVCLPPHATKAMRNFVIHDITGVAKKHELAFVFGEGNVLFLSNWVSVPNGLFLFSWAHASALCLIL